MAKKTKGRRSNAKNSPKLVGIRKRGTAAARRSLVKVHCLEEHNKKTKTKRISLLKSFMNNREVTYTRGTADVNNIQITCTSPKRDDKVNPTQKQIKNSVKTTTQDIPAKVTNPLYITLDATGINDTENDVIVINDDDSDVIYLGEVNNSVIVINDDSIVEALPSKTLEKKTEDGPNKNKQTKPLSASNENVHVQMTMLCPVDNSPQNIPSRITTGNGAPASQFGTFATSTPQRTNAADSFHGVPNLLHNLANLQVGQNSTRSIPSRHIIRTGILSNQIRQIHQSRSNTNSLVGSNFLNAGPVRTQGLRPIFIDASNIAMGHSNGKYFSVEGLKICIDYFKIRGHEVTAIAPMFRKKATQSSNPRLLQQLERNGSLIFTPSRTINGRHIVPYDDRYIVLLANVHKGIIVSSDNYRDLLQEDPTLLETIENRILSPTWVRDMIIFPSDPMGRTGPKLDEFLRFP